MTLKKGFFSNKMTSFSVKKGKMIAGVILGITWSILFYNFLHVIRIFAIISHTMIGNDFEPVFLKQEEKFIYDFLFGFISIYFSFSIIYNYWLERPRKIYERQAHKRTFFLNQQRASNWFFTFWFVETAFLISCFAFYFFEINFYTEYSSFIFIFIIAFIAQIWSSIRPMTKGRKDVSFAVMFFVILLSSFIVSKVSFINPENIQTKLLQSNYIYKNDVHVVSSSLYTKRSLKQYSFDVVIPKTGKDRVLFFEGNKIQIEDLPATIFRTRQEYSDFEIPYLTYNLFIDKQTEMKFVYELKKKLIDLNIERISYSVKKEGSNKPFYYKSNYVFQFFLPGNIIPKEETIKEKELILKRLDIKKYLFEGEIINDNELYSSLKEYYLKNGIKSLRFLMHKETSFEEYFKVLECSKKVINDFRNELSRKAYAVDYFSLNEEQRKTILEKYRWHIIDEITY